MRIEPIGDRLLVQRIDEEERVADGLIILPDTARETPLEAEVLAVGDGRLENGVTVAMRVAVSDRILIGKYAGTEFKMEQNGRDLLLLREDEVLGIVRDTKAAYGVKKRRKG